MGISSVLLVGAFAVGLVILYIIFRIVSLPVRTLWKFIVNSIIGAVGLWLLNVVFGLHIPINIFTALIVGTFGVPGMLVVVICHLL